MDKKLKKIVLEDGTVCINRVCHFEEHKERDDCYGCPKLTFCNKMIFERLLEYEETGLLPEQIIELQKSIENNAQKSVDEEALEFVQNLSLESKISLVLNHSDFCSYACVRYDFCNMLFPDFAQCKEAKDNIASIVDLEKLNNECYRIMKKELSK